MSHDRSTVDRSQVWLRTEDYLKDALGSVVVDIEDMAVNLLVFVNAQVRLALSSCALKTYMLRYIQRDRLLQNSVYISYHNLSLRSSKRSKVTSNEQVKVCIAGVVYIRLGTTCVDHKNPPTLGPGPVPGPGPAPARPH